MVSVRVNKDQFKDMFFPGGFTRDELDVIYDYLVKCSKGRCSIDIILEDSDELEEWFGVYYSFDEFLKDNEGKTSATSLSELERETDVIYMYGKDRFIINKYLLQ